MEQRTEPEVSPYRVFSRAEWAGRRADTPMTLRPEEITRLRSMHDRLDISEVEEIYLPLSRLLSLYVAATQGLFRAQEGFLGTEDTKMPYIIGVGGSVAAGKSTTARVLQALLARWPNVPKVDLLTTDGFLFPNAVLEREGLMEKKGFPESYDLTGAVALSVRHQGRPPSGAGARIFASGLRRHPQPMGRNRPAGHSHRRGAQRAAGGPSAERRQGDSVRLGFLRFFGLSRCRRGCAAVVVRQSFSDVARHGVRRSEILLPPLCQNIGCRSSRYRDVDLEPHQPRQSARKYPADAACAPTSF